MAKVGSPLQIKRRVPWGWIGLGLLGAMACVGFIAARNAPLSLPITYPVQYKAGERNPVLMASGYLVARHRATLSSKVPGRIAWLGVEEGARVAKGQILRGLLELG